MRITDYIKAADNGDVALAISRAAADAVNQKDYTIIFPAGNWTLSSRPVLSAIGPFGTPLSLKLVGQGQVATALSMNFVPPSGGCLDFLDIGGGLEELTIYPLLPSLVAIRLFATSLARRAGWWYAKNVRISTGNGTLWNQCLLLDGNNASINGSQGIRDIGITDCSFFCATGPTVELRNAVHFKWMGGGVFPAGAPSAQVLVTGGVGAWQQSDTICLFGLSCVGTLTLDQVDRVRFDGQASYINITANAKNVLIDSLGPSRVIGQTVSGLRIW